jgi:hypothetical protein
MHAIYICIINYDVYELFLAKEIFTLIIIKMCQVPTRSNTTQKQVNVW